VVRILLRFKK